MRKFFISFSNLPAIEKNANEYSVYPKTNTFGAKFDEKEITAAFTSGKGKSAIPNYYLYFRDEKNSIFYFRSNPEEIESAKKGFAIYSTEPVKAAEEPEADPGPTEADRPAGIVPDRVEAPLGAGAFNAATPKRRRTRATA
jgi:hypothetical protein